MKATDLIHGGHYLLGKHKEVVKFYALNGFFYTLDNRCIGQAYAFDKSERIGCLIQGSVWMEVNPIPLTEEILEKNEFKQRGDEYMFFEWDGAKQWYVSLEDFKPQFDFWFITSSDRDLNVRGKIRYVHELQHALRLCGLNELADNFMV